MYSEKINHFWGSRLEVFYSTHLVRLSDPATFDKIHDECCFVRNLTLSTHNNPRGVQVRTEYFTEGIHELYEGRGRTIV